MLSTEKVETIHLAFFNHIVLIINQKKKEAGTGTLIQIDNACYVVTALPVIENTHAEEIYIDSGIRLSREPIRIESIIRNEKYGYACMKINPFDAKYRTGVGKTPFQINEKVTIGDVPTFKDFGIVGFPGYDREVEGKAVTRKSQHILGLRPLPSESWPDSANREEKNKKTHWLFKYGIKQDFKMVNEKGKERVPVDPNAFRGSPIWVYDSDMGDDNVWYGLVGIQTGYYRRSNCLVGIKIGLIIDKLTVY